MKCPKHPKYKAIYRPRNCETCLTIYKDKRAGEVDPRERLAEFVEHYRLTLSIRPVADIMGLNFHQGRWLYLRAIESGLLQKPAHAERVGGHSTAEEIKATPVAGRIHAPATAPIRREGARRYLLTCAQNNTSIHEGVWENLQALAKHYKAKIMVARSVYNRFARSSEMDKKLLISGATPETRRYWWEPRLSPYFSDERVRLAGNLVWCGEINTMPTAAQPLAGLDSYTGRDSCVIPHPRIAMRSVVSHPSDHGTKLMYTTGTLTQRNYIQRKAGQMAEFHHCYGALLVEVDNEGDWWSRQVHAGSDGVLHDLGVMVADGVVTTGNSLEAISWGDIHVAYGDPVTYKLAWGEGGMLDQLRPKYQFMHDLLDFRVRNPHVIKNNFNLQAFAMYVAGHIKVSDEIDDTAAFLATSYRDWCETVVVDSNHDNFLIRWLDNVGDFRKDPANAVYFLKAALALWTAVERGQQPNMTQWAMTEATKGPAERTLARFLGDDESFIICDENDAGIECGLHGHERFNGARGGPPAFAKVGRKINIGHTHSAGIWDGVYVGGVMGRLNQGYNSGLGSWTQSNILVYPNGKRTIQTIFNGKAWA